MKRPDGGGGKAVADGQSRRRCRLAANRVVGRAANPANGRRVTTRPTGLLRPTETRRTDAVTTRPTGLEGYGLSVTQRTNWPTTSFPSQGDS